MKIQCVPFTYDVLTTYHIIVDVEDPHISAHYTSYHIDLRSMVIKSTTSCRLVDKSVEPRRLDLPGSQLGAAAHRRPRP